MNKQKTNKASKLNDLDRRILSTYSCMSLETGRNVHTCEPENGVKIIQRSMVVKT